MKLEAHKQRQTRAQEQKEREAKREAEKKEKEKQPLNDPIIRMDDEVKLKTDEKERNKSKDKTDGGKKKERSSIPNKN